MEYGCLIWDGELDDEKGITFNRHDSKDWIGVRHLKNKTTIDQVKKVFKEKGVIGGGTIIGHMDVAMDFTIDQNGQIVHINRIIELCSETLAKEVYPQNLTT